jgi:hypothetical protein
MLLRQNGTPFYVGKGRKNRWKDHEKNCLKGKTHKDRILQHMIHSKEKILYAKISENLTNEEAKDLEITTIRNIGRYPRGPLSNGTDGGDGTINFSPEILERIREKLRGHKLSEETKAKLSRIHTGMVFTEEHKRNMSLAKRRDRLSKETLEKRSKSLTGQKRTQEHKEKMRQSRLRYLESQKEKI